MVEQKCYSGVGAIGNLKSILNEIQPKKIFLVTGKGSYRTSGAERTISPLIANYEDIRISDFSTNPKMEDIIEGIGLYNSNYCDFVVAVGGGSVLDVAKSINILSKQDCEPIKCLTDHKEIKEKGNPLVAIPTTAGSGSESTHFSVVYLNGRKYSLAHKEFLRPDYYVLDPLLTQHLPKDVAAVGGLDALSQAIESIWNVNSNTESYSYAEEAIRLIIANFQKVLSNPDIDSRMAMAKAANLAGKAINITKTTAPHAFSYFLTEKYGVPHGHAVALTLGPILKYNSEVTEEDCNDERGTEHVRSKIDAICSLIGCKSPKEASYFLTSLIQESGLETDFTKLGILKQEIQEFSTSVNQQRLKNNPRHFHNAKRIEVFFIKHFFEENRWEP